MPSSEFVVGDLFALKKCHDVLFSPDGSELAVVTDGKLELWDVASGKLSRKLGRLPHEGQLGFSPNGERIALKNPRGDVAVVDRQSGALISKYGARTRDEGPAPVFVDDGTLVDARWSGSVTFRGAESLEPIFEWSAQGGMVQSAAATPTACIALATARPGGEATFVAWRVRRGAPGKPQVFAAPLLDRAFFRRDLRRAVVRFANEPQLGLVEFDASLKPKLVLTRKLDAKPPGLTWHFFGGVFSPSGDVFVTGDIKTGLYVLDGSTLELRSLLPIAGACGAHFSPDGALLAVSSTKRGVVLRVRGEQGAQKDPVPVAGKKAPLTAKAKRSKRPARYAALRRSICDAASASISARLLTAREIVRTPICPSKVVRTLARN